MFDEDTTATQMPAYKQRSAGAQVYYCSECQSVLHPRAPNSGINLEYYCSQCKTAKIVEDNRVYVNILKRNGADSFTTTRSVSDDPTLRRKRAHCNVCGSEQEFVIFNAPALAGEERMDQMVECCNCHTQSAEVYD